MFSFLDKWFRKSKSEDNWEIYHPNERQVYEYFDGEKQVRADPMTLTRKLMAVGPELNIDMKLACSIHSEASKGYENALSKLRGIFSVKSLENGGLTEDETFSLFNHFMQYNDHVKKNSRTSPTTSMFTEGLKSISAPDLPTSNTMDSGSTENKLFSEPLEQSLTA